jgi:hypothetical protein
MPGMDLEILSGLASMMGDDDDMSGAMMGMQNFNYLAGDDGEQAMLGAIAGYNPELAMMMGWSPWGAIKTAIDPRTPFKAIANLAKGKNPFAAGNALGVGKPNRAAQLQKALQVAQQGQAMQAMAAQQASPFAQPTPLSMVQPQLPGVPDRGGRVQPLGFENGAFTAAGPAVVTIRARPQRPLRGGRLVADFTRTGATATGLLTLVQLVVATDGQLLSGDPISFAALSPNAFGVGVNLSPAAVGNEIFATVAISALPTMTDRVDFNLTLFGLTVG